MQGQTGLTGGRADADGERWPRGGHGAWPTGRQWWEGGDSQLERQMIIQSNRAGLIAGKILLGSKPNAMRRPTAIFGASTTSRLRQRAQKRAHITQPMSPINFGFARRCSAGRYCRHTNSISCAAHLRKT